MESANWPAPKDNLLNAEHVKWEFNKLLSCFRWIHFHSPKTLDYLNNKRKRSNITKGDISYAFFFFEIINWFSFRYALIDGKKPSWPNNSHKKVPKLRTTFPNLTQKPQGKHWKIFFTNHTTCTLASKYFWRRTNLDFNFTKNSWKF